MDVKPYLRVLDRRLRRASLALLAVALCATLALPAAAPAQAQGGTGQPVAVGDVVSGTLDADNFVQVYWLLASAGDTITVDLTTDDEDLGIVVVMADERGNIIARDVDLETPTSATLADTQIPTNGTYYIMVMRGSGATGDPSGSYTLRLSGIQQVGGQTVTLTEGGIVFDLAWEAAVDLNLEVRDPVGGTVHRLSPGSPSGGVLDADVNNNCDAVTAESPTETIAWPIGEVPAGSYEVIVYYTDGCAVGGPQLFTLNATVGADTTQSLIGTLNPGQEYLVRLELGADEAWQLVNGGVNAGLDVTTFRTAIANAEPVALGSTVSGVITNSSPARAYRFVADAGATIQADLRAQSGSLDSYLALLGPDGMVIVANDDANETTTDAGISRTLPNEGEYILLATRYGLAIGGTEGEYTLTLTASPPVATGDVAGTPPTTAVTPVVQDGLPEGAIEIRLDWSTNAHLQLLVRDPIGDTVYNDVQFVQSGGILEVAGNIGCVDTTPSPLSYAYWPPGQLPRGVYEIEVWYQNTCNDPRPVNFGLTVVVQGQTVINLSQTANPDSRYMITFIVEPDGTVIAGPGGFFNMANPDSLNYQERLPTATAVTYGQTVSGSITEQQRFQVYSFEGTQGDLATIGMNQASGTLDPALYLLSPQQILVAYNDDVAPGENPNSVIDQVTLPVTGTYYIIATHYGLDVGGTQGTFNLTLVED